MIEYLMARLQVSEIQVEMAYYSGAIPKNIDPEPFILHWEKRLIARRNKNNPKRQD
jgi:hypothetical protein